MNSETPKEKGGRRRGTTLFDALQGSAHEIPEMSGVVLDVTGQDKSRGGNTPWGKGGAGGIGKGQRGKEEKRYRGAGGAWGGSPLGERKETKECQTPEGERPFIW